ncbi:hypothetical protein HMPREF9466_00026 [Fusobacterium necrophorum subsp. funduliforme 1_1_36S]|nr:hypothetical protein HMPREF9466_00026 [Fusobacterium necrophorum subsp. funduliforme 1_1_36S]
MIIGITGTIASGKSTVSDYFIKQGYEVIDADKITKELQQKRSTRRISRNIWRRSTVGK